MLRQRSIRRPQAAQQNTAGNIVVTGTGYRHRVEQWPISSFTGRRHKLVMPPDSPDKKFVLLVGCSHLRAIADGYVKMPEGLSFGVLSTPGACAAELQKEVTNAVVPREPDVVCVLAPSNDLTASRTPDEAGVSFAKLLHSVCSRWPQVVVLDFPPRLNVAVDVQNHLRQEFHRVAARAGVKYISTAEHFPMHNRKLWSPDGVHLSDREGMGVLVQLFWTAAYLHLESTVPKPSVVSKPSLPARRFSPKVVVKGEVAAPRPRQADEDGYVTVSYSRKRQRSWEAKKSHGAPKRIVQQQVLKKCCIPLTHARFSSKVLAVMDAFVPAQKNPHVEHQQKATSSKRKPAEPQLDAAPSVEVVSRKLPLARTVIEDVKAKASPSRAVPLDVDEEGQCMSPKTVKGVEVCFLTDSMCRGLEDAISNIKAFVHPGTTVSRSLSKHTYHFKQLSEGALVVINIGTNDIASGVCPSLLVQKMESLIQQIQHGHEDIHVAVCSVLPRPVDDHKSKALIRQFNGLMERKTTLMCNVVFLNPIKKFVSRGDILCDLFNRDGVHLNKKGKDILFSYFQKFLWHFCRHV